MFLDYNIHHSLSLDIFYDGNSPWQNLEAQKLPTLSLLGDKTLFLKVLLSSSDPTCPLLVLSTAGLWAGPMQSPKVLVKKKNHAQHQGVVPTFWCCDRAPAHDTAGCSHLGRRSGQTDGANVFTVNNRAIQSDQHDVVLSGWTFSGSGTFCVSWLIWAAGSIRTTYDFRTDSNLLTPS